MPCKPLLRCAHVHTHNEIYGVMSSVRQNHLDWSRTGVRGPSTAFNILTVVRPWPSFCFVFPERKGGKDIFSNHLFVFFCFLFDLSLPYDIKVGCCSPFFFVCVFQIFVAGISQRLCGKSGFGRFFFCWPIVCRIEGKGVVVFVFFLSFFLCCGVEGGGGHLMVTQRQSLVSVFGQFVISSLFRIRLSFHILSLFGCLCCSPPLPSPFGDRCPRKTRNERARKEWNERENWKQKKIIRRSMTTFSSSCVKCVSRFELVRHWRGPHSPIN